MGTITIEIDEKHVLVRHNESLQAALTKRNEEIERLRARLDAGEESPLIAAAHARGYKKGWVDCSNRLTTITADAARALGEIRKEAFQVYLGGDNLGRS